MKAVLVLLAGLAHALSVAWPFGFAFASGQALGWLNLLALALLAWRLNAASTPRQGACVGWLFGVAMLSATFWWLYISMHTYGGLAAPLAGAAVLALAAALALIYAAAGAAYVALRAAGPGWGALVFAALWTLADLARGYVFTGFPWGASGYAHIDGWLAGYAPWVGVYGVGAVSAWLAATLALLHRAGYLQRLLWILILVLPWQAPWRASDTPQGPALDVTLLQGQIPQDQKFQPGTGVADSLRWYGEQLRATKTSLVVAPETAIPMLPQQLPQGYWPGLASVFSEVGTNAAGLGREAAPARAALIGVPLGSYSEGYTNSVVGLKPGLDSPYRYDKHHLVAFGEFIPVAFKWFTRLMHIPLGDMTAGAPLQPSFVWQGQRLAPNICYEDLFGEEIGARFADPANAPTIFVNVSNLAWFDDSVAIDQHLNIARMRSLEFARPTLRATNTGATVIIDHHGAVQSALPRSERGALVGQVWGRGLSAANNWDLTPYAIWVSRLGLWPLALLAALVLALAYRQRRAPS